MGDIVYLDAGRQIPADLRLLETVSMKVEESALTGESLPVERMLCFRQIKHVRSVTGKTWHICLLWSHMEEEQGLSLQ